MQIAKINLTTRTAFKGLADKVNIIIRVKHVNASKTNPKERDDDCYTFKATDNVATSATLDILRQVLPADKFSDKGLNYTTTNATLYNAIKDKTLVVADNDDEQDEVDAFYDSFNIIDER